MNEFNYNRRDGKPKFSRDFGAVPRTSIKTVKPHSTLNTKKFEERMERTPAKQRALSRKRRAEKIEIVEDEAPVVAEETSAVEEVAEVEGVQVVEEITEDIEASVEE